MRFKSKIKYNLINTINCNEIFMIPWMKAVGIKFEMSIFALHNFITTFTCLLLITVPV